MNASILAISGISIKQDSHGRFCLNDLHKAAGNEAKHKPDNWKRAQQTIDLISLLESENCNLKPVDVINGGIQRGTYVVKELVYAYAMWISAKFHITVIRAYDALVSPKPYALRDLPAQQMPSGLSELLTANLTPLKKIMMLTLASKADKNGDVQISVHNLANICGIAKSTTSESLIGLEKSGFLSVTKTRCPNGGSMPNTYTLPERFRFASGELVEPTMQHDWINQPVESPALQIPDGTALVDTKWLAEIEKNASLQFKIADLKFFVEQAGGLVLMKCEVDRMKGVLKA